MLTVGRMADAGMGHLSMRYGTIVLVFRVVCTWLKAWIHTTFDV